jgi:hypothetical protein
MKKHRLIPGTPYLIIDKNVSAESPGIGGFHALKNTRSFFPLTKNSICDRGRHHRKLRPQGVTRNNGPQRGKLNFPSNHAL